MIFKVFRRRDGNSNPRQAVDYLVYEKDGQEPRQGARVLSGDIEQTLELAKTLDFKNRYTMDCLSFKEHSNALSDEQKMNIIAECENTLFSGLGRERYSIAWVEHTDKGRLELNFFIANVDLATGKTINPYYHRGDSKRINAFKRYVNAKYNLADPEDPEDPEDPKFRKSSTNKPKQLIEKISKERDIDFDKLERLESQGINTPLNEIKNKAMVIEAIKRQLDFKFANGFINSTDDVKHLLQDMGLQISRQSNKSISIKHPAGGNNIKLTGYLYEQQPTQTSIAKSFSEQLQEKTNLEMKALQAHQEHQAQLAEQVEQIIAQSAQMVQRLEKQMADNQAYIESQIKLMTQTAMNELLNSKNSLTSTLQSNSHTMKNAIQNQLSPQQLITPQLKEQLQKDIQKTFQKMGTEAIQYRIEQVDLNAKLALGTVIALLIVIAIITLYATTKIH